MWTAAPSPQVTDHGTRRLTHATRIFGFLAMVFGMLMAILDIQIVSALLSEIQARLSASLDEVAWVQTAYLIAEVIMIPLSGILGRILSTRVLFAGSALGFTAASFLCSTATNIDQMMICRAIQGFIGGGMIPSVFAAAFTICSRAALPMRRPAPSSRCPASYTNRPWSCPSSTRSNF